jgi:hypothetical protein
MLEIDLDCSTDLKSIRPMAPALLNIRALYSFRREQVLATRLQEAAREEPDCLIVLAARSEGQGFDRSRARHRGSRHATLGDLDRTVFGRWPCLQMGYLELRPRAGIVRITISAACQGCSQNVGERQSPFRQATLRCSTDLA